MASSSIRKPCATGNGCKQAAIFNCEGCSQAFCTKHAADHRHLLGEEINEIIGEHDNLRNTLLQQTSKPELHPLIKQINDWEHVSIAKIRQRANDARQELLHLTAEHTDELLKQLQKLSEPLKQGQEDDNFIETDLLQWKEKLEKLKADFISPSTIAINQNETVPLISDFNIGSKGLNELFDQVFNNATRIVEHGQVAFHDSSSTYTEIRGKNEYTSGFHKLRFRIEASSNNWIFLGINSKLTPLRDRPYGSKSTYGWSSDNCPWSNGQAILNNSSVPIKMQTNDVITLTFDCDNRKICIINDRTNSKHEMIVDINHCPLPWQLHVFLLCPNDRLRILST